MEGRDAGKGLAVERVFFGLSVEADMSVLRFPRSESRALVARVDRQPVSEIELYRSANRFHPRRRYRVETADHHGKKSYRLRRMQRRVDERY